MKIAVLSDIHDHIWNLEKALGVIEQENCESIIYCGDFCAPFIPPYLIATGMPVYACFGNNDEDQGMIYEKSEGKIKFWPLADEFGEIEIDSQKIAFCHYPKLGQLLAASNEYQAVFHGHTHKAYQKTIGNTVLANPGAVCGIISGRPGSASFGIYDTATNSFVHLDI